MYKAIAALVSLSALPAAALGLLCAGDCNLDGWVTAEEVVLATRVAAAQEDLESCAAADVDENGSVSAAELASVTDSVLLGCPYLPGTRPDPVDGCENGFVVGTSSNLEETNVSTLPLVLSQGQGRVRSIELPGGDPGFELSGTFSTCPQMPLSRIVTFAVRSRTLVTAGEFFIDNDNTRFAYAEAQGGASAFVHGWRAVDGAIVIDAATDTTVAFHCVGARMVPDSQSGPTGTFTMVANGGLDALTP